MPRALRPLSPDLQIYRPQLTSVMSITHRATGVALSAGALLLVWWLASAAAGPDAYARLHALLATDLGLTAMLVWTFALFYHLCNGIRHLFWDAGRGFGLRTIYASGWTVFGTSIALTAIAWILSSKV
ncbi:MAG: succinate dehydrogenase, cytochrome b556 subunit [Proteobacteria bacterium]|nr:succinate dehydrogenase, cytochrome b556 subunit [Pseudomonadota bacterium]